MIKPSNTRLIQSAARNMSPKAAACLPEKRNSEGLHAKSTKGRPHRRDQPLVFAGRAGRRSAASTPRPAPTAVSNHDKQDDHPGRGRELGFVPQFIRDIADHPEGAGLGDQKALFSPYRCRKGCRSLVGNYLGNIFFVIPRPASCSFLPVQKVGKRQGRERPGLFNPDKKIVRIFGNQIFGARAARVLGEAFDKLRAGAAGFRVRGIVQLDRDCVAWTATLVQTPRRRPAKLEGLPQICRQRKFARAAIEVSG